jgi:hypothetical protein
MDRLPGGVDASAKGVRVQPFIHRAKSFLTQLRSISAMQAGCLCNGRKGDLA